jgi:hypothetical protein
MVQSVSIQQAAANALCTWLVAKLPSDVALSGRWPEPTVPLGLKTVTVLLAGQAEDEITEPIVVDQTNTPGAPTALYTYRIRCRRQALQLDVFTQYDVDRDDIMARLDAALNVGEAASLGLLAQNPDPMRNGLALALGDGWPGIADYFFEGPTVTDDADSEQTTDYRATYRGHVDMMLTMTTEAAISRLMAITLRQTVPVGLFAQSPADVTTVSSSSTYDDSSGGSEMVAEALLREMVEDLEAIRVSLEWSKAFTTALSTKLIVSSVPARIRSVSGRVDATAPTGVYFIHCWNLVDIPANSVVVSSGNALIAPVKVNHVLGTDNYFALDFSGTVRASAGITVGLSTAEFTQAGAGPYLSATAEFGP